MTGPHVHQHAEAFYVLEGELTFEIGAEGQTITVGAGGFVAVPPGTVHAYGTAGDQPARWLIVHAPDGGFADFMRGLRDGVEVDWDMTPVFDLELARQNFLRYFRLLGLQVGGFCKSDLRGPCVSSIVRPSTRTLDADETHQHPNA